MGKERILVVDDEDSIQYVISTLFTRKGFEVTTVGAGDEALRILEAAAFDLALLDIVLPGASGLQVLERLRERDVDTPVIMMTSHASVDTAIEALRKGAYDYLHKPFELDEILAVAERALEKRRLTIQNRTLLREKTEQNKELEGAVRRLRSLNSAGMAMSGIASLAELLDFFVEIVQQELEADRVSLMLLDETGNSLRIAAARGLSEDVIRETRVPLGEGVAGKVAQAGEVVIANQPGVDIQGLAGEHPGAVGPFAAVPISIGVPIRTSREILGVLNVTNRHDARAIDQEDASYLLALAGQAAVAIERARESDHLRTAYDELKGTQDQLVASGRLNALGEMAAGVAHDFNNILNGILSRSQLIRRVVAGESVSKERIDSYAEYIEKLAAQGAESVRRIQEFSRVRRGSTTDRVHLDESARFAVALTEPRWREESRSRGVEVKIEMDLQEVPEVAASAPETAQVIGNLIFNAVEAMPGGGTIRIRTSSEGERVSLEVSDSGSGMSREVRERIFEPFFTTKRDGQGLGMSVVYGIVTRLDGRIEVASEEGKGTRVRIDFPAAAPASVDAVTGSAAGAENVSMKRGRVLIVDDDLGTLEVCRDLLEREGHEVHTAESGQAGLDHIAEGVFDLVITDLGMPELSGWEIARATKDSSPTTPVMLLTGWRVPQAKDEARSTGVDLVVRKPVGVDAFLGSVRKLLAD